MIMQSGVFAWHFVDDKLRNGDPIPSDGVWLNYDRPLKLCKSGLHASLTPWDALQYAPGSTLCYVECKDLGKKEDDKFVCAKRKIISRKNIEEQLFEFARGEALKVVHLWEAPTVVINFLKIGDKTLRSAAWSAAWSAAESAARSAARYAARSAARYAAESAARSAARYAAESATRSAARPAARPAAWSAAESAAWSASKNEFNQMVKELFNVI